ncbi:Prkcsh [Symbiodinium sp. CCMP2456]|nr:Prkcsh [Symbiodinium sp. CCMP2456]
MILYSHWGSSGRCLPQSPRISASMMRALSLAFLGHLALLEASPVLRSGPSKLASEEASGWLGFRSVYTKMETSIAGLFGEAPHQEHDEVQKAQEDAKEKHDSGVVVETRVLSINNKTSAEKPSMKTLEAEGEKRNFTVHMLSNDVTPEKSSVPKVKIVPEPTKAPSKDDFVVHIKSLERVDGKKPFRRSKSQRTTTPAATTTKDNVQINVWTVTDAPPSKSEVKPSRLEYDSSPWANDWGDEWKPVADAPKEHRAKVTTLHTPGSSMLRRVLCWQFVTAWASQQLLGSRPQVAFKYLEALQQGSFNCFDGSAVLETDAVNDDFCDCADGSDEPGTPACAGVGLFYCSNVESIPKLIYSSHVADGICDCCDGSDEWSSSCPNTCSLEGPVLRAQQQALRADRHRGRELRRSGETEALKQVAEWREEHEGLKKLLASAASAKQSMAPLAGVETVAPQLGAQPGTSGSPVVSEYARWAVQAVPQRVPEPSSVQCWVGEFANAKEVCCDRSQGPLGRSQCWDGVYTFAACCGDESGNSDDAKLQRVYEQDAEEAARQSRKLKGRLFAIERKLAAVESGLRWFSLVEQCVERRFLSKDFKLCFFQDARQGSVHVGSFDGWEGKAMLYTGGQRCPAGPARSMKVWLTCAGEVGLLDVSEVSLCTYEAVAGTPGACEVDLDPGDDELVLMPHDEEKNASCRAKFGAPVQFLPLPYQCPRHVAFQLQGARHGPSCAQSSKSA